MPLYALFRNSAGTKHTPHRECSQLVVHLKPFVEGLNHVFRLVSCLAVLTFCVTVLTAQNSPIPGKFYEYYPVASTQAGTFTVLGPPSINQDGLCAFMGQTAIGQTI